MKTTTLLLVASTFLLSAWAGAQSLPLNRVSLAKVKNHNPHSPREVFFQFTNNQLSRIQSNQALVTVNGKQYLGKVFAKTESGLRLRFAIAPGEEGAVVISVPNAPWEHCQKIKMSAKFDSVDPINNKLDAFSVTGEQRIYDEVYASGCNHLKN